MNLGAAVREIMVGLGLRHLPGQHDQSSHGHGGGLDFDADGWVASIEIEGNFGNLAMGLDDAGDVQISFLEGRDQRDVGLSNDDLAEMADAIGRLTESRDEVLDNDEIGDDQVYDYLSFGSQEEHRVDVLGNGLMVVTFGVDDAEPYELQLDPDEEVDDVSLLLDAIEEILAAAEDEGFRDPQEGDDE